MKLFKYEGYDVVISEEALCLKPFKQIWKRDRSDKKEKAKMELAYIYFMEDPRSDYQMYIDREERHEKIKEGEGLKKDWEPDTLITEAQAFYSSFKSASALLLEDIKTAIHKLRKFIAEIDLSATDEKGKPLYTMDSYTRTIKMIPTLITDLDEAERALAKEIVQNDKVRGSKEKAMFEDE